VLEPGTLIGPYEVVDLIATGGMGHVYRARDPRLGREVAVKVLPELLAAEPDRVRRFEQEARAASMLNHPNILAIYDVGSHDGTLYVVSELLEGETLRDRIREAPLPPSKVVEHAIQVARGLTAAHERGIVHRDLKPENLFITRDGIVKILDFGLAKLTRPRRFALKRAAGENEPARTDSGVMFGTMGYMSPEQVRGQAVDHRSDIFGLGAILYEMLTGMRAFAADTPLDTMNQILKEDPPPLRAASESVPPSLERVIRRCLEKRREDRFQKTRDLVFALEAVNERPGEVETPAPRRAGRIPATRLVLGAVLLGSVALAAGFLLGRGREAAIPSYSRLTYRRGTVTGARFAPDGQTVLYSAAWDANPSQIFLKRPESEDSLPLELPGAVLLSVSNSGEMAILLHPRIAHYGVWSGTLARVPLTGGTPRQIAEHIEQAEWAPDGERLALVREAEERTRLEFPAGKVLYETSGHISYPRFSADGDSIAFFDHPLPGDDRGSVALVDLAGNVRTLSPGWESVQGLAWSADGKEIWFTATGGGQLRSLYAVTTAGRLRLVSRAPGPLLLRDVSRSGHVLLTRDDIRWGIFGRGPGQSSERDLSWLEFSLTGDISADGRFLLFEEQSVAAGPNYAVCLRRTDGTPPVRLGNGMAFGLSPDGRWVISCLPSAPSKLALLPTGPGEAKHLELGGLNAEWAKWLPDGKGIIFASSPWGGHRRLWVESLKGGAPRPVTPDGFDVSPRGGYCVSPDGKWVATVGPSEEVWLYPLEGGEPRAAFAVERDEAPIRWGSDGRFIFTAERGEPPGKIFKVELANGHRELWREVMPADAAGVRSIGRILITPDGASYAYTYSRLLSELYLVDGLK
jgi:Tol biopolymer transport system component